MYNAVTRWLCNRAFHTFIGILGTEPDLTLFDENAKPQLRRWHIIPRNRFFNIYVHHFLRPDRRVPHDHPWWSWSWCLQGCHIDRSYDPLTWKQYVHTVEPGQIRFRKATTPHRIELFVNAADENGVPTQYVSTMTLFFTGPRFRVWGFHCDDGKDFVPWEDFRSKGWKCD